MTIDFGTSKRVLRGTTFAGALLVLAACGGVRDVSTGSEGAEYNLNRCFGERTNCRSAKQAVAVTVPDMLECAGASEASLTLDFAHNVEQDRCSGPACQVTLLQLATAPDGTAWTLGQLRRGDSNVTILLGHYGLDGTRIGEAEVVSTTNPFTSFDAHLTVDDRGHAYVAWYSVYSPNADAELVEALWLQEYDPLAQQQGTALSFSGTASALVQAGSGGRIAMAANANNNARRGSLALLDRSGTLLWNQTNVVTSGQGSGAGVTGLVLGSGGQSTLLAERGHSREGEVILGLSRFDADGNSVWDLNLAWGFEAGYHATLLGDAAGNIVAAGYLNKVPPGPELGQPTLVGSFDREGHLRWAMSLYGAGGGVAPVLAMEPVSGRIFALGNTASGSTIFQISGDGQTCQRYSAGAGFDTYTLAVGTHGDLYALSQRSLSRYSGVTP
jgi:hypothetical protein